MYYIMYIVLYLLLTMVIQTQEKVLNLKTMA